MDEAEPTEVSGMPTEVSGVPTEVWSDVLIEVSVAAELRELRTELTELAAEALRELANEEKELATGSTDVRVFWAAAREASARRQIEERIVVVLGGYG